MLELYLALLIFPALMIAYWERLLAMFSGIVFPVYRFTGLIGTPVHELAHALACLIFGMPIVRMSMYNFFPAYGTMGFVNFSYRPGSLIHMIGRVVQGVAPLLAGGAITIWLLDLYAVAVFPEPTTEGILSWLHLVATQTLDSAIDLGLSTPIGALSAFIVVSIAIHAIPSRSDIRIGLSGLMTAIIIISLIILGIDTLAQLAQPFTSLYTGKSGVLHTHLLPLLDRVLHWATRWIHIGLFWALYGAVAVITLSISATAVFILLPAAILLLLKWAYKGATNRYGQDDAISIAQLKGTGNHVVSQSPETDAPKTADSPAAPPVPEAPAHQSGNIPPKNEDK